MNVYNWDEGVVEEPTEELSELDKAIADLTIRLYEDLCDIKLTEKDRYAIYTFSSDDLNTYMLNIYPELFI